ncbi:MAG: hypothetical protein U0Y08_11755 [Bacteroidia bacterium]
MSGIREIHSRKELGTFIRLPLSLYRDYPDYVPPVFHDEWHLHDGSGEATKHCRTIHFLAEENGKVTGRIMGIIRDDFNERFGLKTARFFNFDCVNDFATAKALLDAVAEWAKREGMQQLIGPFGFSDKDPQGFQVEGYQHRAVISAPSHPPWMPALVEQLGYTKHVDCLSYQLSIPEEIPGPVQEISKRILSSGNYRLIRFRKRSEMKGWILPVFELVNTTYSHLFGFMPMSDAEMQEMAKQFLPVLDPAFTVLVADRENKPIAFVIAMPDISIGLQKAKGALFPFGFIHILKAMKTATQLNLLLGAVHPQCRQSGITAILAVSILEETRRRNMNIIDSHLVLEENPQVRKVLERFGGKIVKRFRIYEHRFK